MPAVWFYLSAGRIWRRHEDGQHQPVHVDEVEPLKFELARHADQTDRGQTFHQKFIQLCAVDLDRRAREA